MRACSCSVSAGPLPLSLATFERTFALLSVQEARKAALRPLYSRLPARRRSLHRLSLSPGPLLPFSPSSTSSSSQHHGVLRNIVSTSTCRAIARCESPSSHPALPLPRFKLLTFSRSPGPRFYHHSGLANRSTGSCTCQEEAYQHWQAKARSTSEEAIDLDGQATSNDLATRFHPGHAAQASRGWRFYLIGKGSASLASSTGTIDNGDKADRTSTRLTSQKEAESRLLR